MNMGNKLTCCCGVAWICLLFSFVTTRTEGAATIEAGIATIYDLLQWEDEVSGMTQAVSLLSDLVDALDSHVAHRYFTVFAPNNAAFSKFQATSLGLTSADDLFLPQHSQLLRRILWYHVIPREVFTENLPRGRLVTALGGVQDSIFVTIRDVKRDRKIRLNRSGRLKKANLVAANGIVHVINELLIPPSLLPTPDVVTLAQEDDQLSSLVGALRATPTLLSTLALPDDELGAVNTTGRSGSMDHDSDSGGRNTDMTGSSYTMFAPSNGAFKRLLSQFEDLLDPDNKDLLTNILSYHVVPGTYKSNQWLFSNVTVSGRSRGDSTLVSLGTLLPQTTLHVSVRTKKRTGQRVVVLNGSTRVIVQDMEASNGIVHVINDVLIPPHLQVSLGGKSDSGDV